MVWKLFSLLKTGDVLPVSDINHHYNSNKNNHAWTIFHWPTSLCWCRFGIETANSPKLHPPLLCTEHPFCIGCSGSRLHCSLMWPQVQVPARGMWASSRKCSVSPYPFPVGCPGRQWWTVWTEQMITTPQECWAIRQKEPGSLVTLGLGHLVDG